MGRASGTEIRRNRGEDAQERHGEEEDEGDHPVHPDGVDHDEDDTDERREQGVDRGAGMGAAP